MCVLKAYYSHPVSFRSLGIFTHLFLLSRTWQLRQQLQRIFYVKYLIMLCKMFFSALVHLVPCTCIPSCFNDLSFVSKKIKCITHFYAIIWINIFFFKLYLNDILRGYYTKKKNTCNTENIFMKTNIYNSTVIDHKL